MIAVLLAGTSGGALAAYIALALTSQRRAERAVIERAEAEFDEYASQAIAVTGLWSDEENEILLGRRPL